MTVHTCISVEVRAKSIEVLAFTCFILFYFLIHILVTSVNALLLCKHYLTNHLTLQLFFLQKCVNILFS